MDQVNTLGTRDCAGRNFGAHKRPCAVAFLLAPDATLDFFSAFMHGLDLKAVKSATDQPWESSLWPDRTINCRLHRWCRVRLGVQRHPTVIAEAVQERMPTHMYRE